MATASYVKLDVNIPMRGDVKFVAHYAERENPNKPGTTYAAQWVLTGVWSWTDPVNGPQKAEGKVGIDEYQLAASPIVLGLAKQEGTWDDGNPKYKWTHNGPVLLLKTKDGKKNHVTISRLDTNGQPVAAQPAAGAASPPPVASTGRATAAVTRSSSGVAPVSGPPSGWDDISRSYASAVRVASNAWLGVNLSPEAKVAAAATVFIEANKRGLTVPAPTREQQAGAVRDAFDRYADMPAALKQDEPPLPSEVPPWAES